MLSIKNHRNNNKNNISTSNIQSISELNLIYPSDSITVFERSVTENRTKKCAGPKLEIFTIYGFQGEVMYISYHLYHYGKVKNQWVNMYIKNYITAIGY